MTYGVPYQGSKQRIAPDIVRMLPSGDVFVDLFAGGCAMTHAALAAEQLGRQARVMEIDPHYCDVILSRWEQLTGRTATKLN